MNGDFQGNKGRAPDICRKRYYLVRFAVFLFSLLWTGRLTAQAKTREVFINKISGNKITYHDVIGYDPDSDAPVAGGSKKTIKLDRNVKFYWFRSDSAMKYERVSRKTFEKRVKYLYYPWARKFERHWQTGKLMRNGQQYVKMQINKGKVTKVWGMYRP